VRHSVCVSWERHPSFLWLSLIGWSTVCRRNLSWDDRPAASNSSAHGHILPFFTLVLLPQWREREQNISTVWLPVMDTLALKESARKQLVPSFSVHHARLVAICFDPQAVPSLSTVQELSVDRLEPIDLQRLSHMVQVEFAASLAKEKTGDDNTTIAKIPEPNPYDVFLMTTTMEQPKTHIAVCLPTRRNGPLMWYNGSDELIPLPWLERKWKIGSLSGVARVLEALSSPATTLTKWAMDRSMLAEPVPLDQVDPSMTRHLNDSQRRAVATVASPTFTEGFLAIQGPPGCGT
jgi:hypothetical protein